MSGYMAMLITTANRENISVDHCKWCEHKSEHYRCTECGMTGQEIARKRSEARV